jgi:hypothetical protein
MTNTPDSPAQRPDDRMILGGNFWTLFAPRIWKVLHAALHCKGDNTTSPGQKKVGETSKIGENLARAFLTAKKLMRSIFDQRFLNSLN